MLLDHDRERRRVSAHIRSEALRRVRAAHVRSEEAHDRARATHRRAAELHHRAAEFQQLHASAERELGRIDKAEKMEAAAERARARARAESIRAERF
jgi:hypothetical protein